MENPKKLYSKKRIEETFLLLLHKKSIERISVTELCEMAGINRSTFYAHYIDIYDLMEKVTDDFVRHLFHDITGKLSAPTGKAARPPVPWCCVLLKSPSRTANFADF